MTRHSQVKAAADARVVACLKAAKTRAFNKKHAGTKKHAKGHPKHHPAAQKQSSQHKAPAQKVHVTHLAPKVAKARALSLAGVSCCSAEALAASLRLTGRPVSDADVLALYRRTADSPDAAASIWATLEAAYRWGLAAVRPVEFRPVLALEEVVPHDDSLFPQRATGAFGLILGLELPEGPHSVLADGGQWFSWGDCWPLSAFGDAVVEEAWAVLWP